MTVIFLFMIQSPPNFIPAPDTATCADGYFFHFHLPRILISWAGLYNSYHPLFSFSNNFSNLALRTLLTWLLWSTCCWLPGLVASLTYLEFRWQFNLRDFAIIFVLPFSIYNKLHSNSQLGPRTNPGKHKKFACYPLSRVRPLALSLCCIWALGPAEQCSMCTCTQHPCHISAKIMQFAVFLKQLLMDLAFMNIKNYTV